MRESNIVKFPGNHVSRTRIIYCDIIYNTIAVEYFEKGTVNADFFHTFGCVIWKVIYSWLINEDPNFAIIVK